MTIEEVQLAMMQNNAAATKLIVACQVRAAQNFETQTFAEKERAENERDASRANFARPSLVHRPLLSQEEDGWCVSYGALHAYGPTPELAHQDFDRLWVGKDEL